MKRSWRARDARPRCARARARIAWCMVGTAVYQVGVRLLEPARRTERVEARRAEDRCPRRERGEHRGDEAVDMEQRHDVEAAVAGGRAPASRRYGRPRRRRWPGCSGTSFGRDVVPEVWSTRAMSSGFGEARRAPASRPASPSSVKCRPGRPDRTRRREDRDAERAAATSTAGWPPASRRRGAPWRSRSVR